MGSVFTQLIYQSDVDSLALPAKQSKVATQLISLVSRAISIYPRVEKNIYSHFLMGSQTALYLRHRIEDGHNQEIDRGISLLQETL